jgi:hypothetical protein
VSGQISGRDRHLLSYQPGKQTQRGNEFITISQVSMMDGFDTMVVYHEKSSMAGTTVTVSINLQLLIGNCM